MAGAWGKSDYSQSSHHVVQVDEGVVDGHHLDLATCGGGTCHQTADTSESETQEETERCVRIQFPWQLREFRGKPDTDCKNIRALKDN